jgi:hypothetical protein
VISATGTSQSYGLQDASCQDTVRGRITNVKVVANGAQFVFGVYGNQSRSYFSNIDSSAEATVIAFGLTATNASLQMTGSRIAASGPAGIQTYGIGVDGAANVMIDNTTITAQTATLYSQNGLATGVLRVGASRLAGGPAQSAAIPFVCAAVYDENYSFFANTCP